MTHPVYSLEWKKAQVWALLGQAKTGREERPVSKGIYGFGNY